MTFKLLSALLLLTALIQPAAAQGPAPPAEDAPSTAGEEAIRQIAELMKAEQFTEAEAKVRRLQADHGRNPLLSYLLACALAPQEKTAPALDALEQLAGMGFNRPDVLRGSKYLASLRNTERFAAILTKVEQTARIRAPLPAACPVVDGVATLSPANVAVDRASGVLRVALSLPPQPQKDTPIYAGQGELAELLNPWGLTGQAAGNHGDFYDNHDSDHSNMRYKLFPTLCRIEYAPELRNNRLHHGLQLALLFNRVILGNSSTALTRGPLWRSNPRIAYTQTGGPEKLYRQYRSNHLYVYPEHRDHDPKHGDVYPANTPYVLISQGSSGSDRPLLQAVAAILASFRPEVKARLVEQGLLMPAVQMVFRRGLKDVTTSEDYLHSKAHQTAIPKERLDMVRQCKLANAITLDTLPPLVRLRVIERSEARAGVDYFAAGPFGGLTLFRTPCAIAEILRPLHRPYRIVVSAEDTISPNDKPVRFHWVILRGSEELVTIKKLREDSSVVEITVLPHPPVPVTPDSEVFSSRVDIGVFGQVGQTVSPPSFVSFITPEDEKRTCDEAGRLLEVDYRPTKGEKRYVDPLLFLRKNWRDVYQYDEAGTLTGWVRHRESGVQQFTAEGELIVQPAEGDGEHPETIQVRYEPWPTEGVATELRQVPAE